MLRVWHPHRPPLRNLLQTNCSLVSGSRYWQWLYYAPQGSLVCNLRDCPSPWIKVQRAEMIRKVTSEALFWSEQKASLASPRKGETHKGLDYCSILLYIFVLKNNNKADLQTTPCPLKYYQRLVYFLWSSQTPVVQVESFRPIHITGKFSPRFDYSHCSAASKTGKGLMSAK